MYRFTIIIIATLLCGQAFADRDRDWDREDRGARSESHDRSWKKASQRHKRWQVARQSQPRVCDPLRAQGTTPGLHGLCVAYCESRDLSSALETRNPKFAARLADSRQKFLDRYNQRRQASDPAMPCVVEESNACSCWATKQVNPELWNNKISSSSCGVVDDPMFSVDSIQTLTSPTDPEYANFAAYRLSMDGGASFSQVCAAEEPATGTSTQQEIGLAEYETCRTQIQTLCSSVTK